MPSTSSPENTDAIVQVVVTAPDHDWLISLADRLLDDRLIGAARIDPGVTTVYDWNDRRHHETESRAVLHTTRRLAGSVRDVVTRAHPYEVPGVLVHAVEPVDTAYSRWVRDRTATPAPTPQAAEPHPAYAALVDRLHDEAVHDDGVHGLILTGSVARGDALPGTDIDVRYLVADGQGRPFQSSPRDGILVEQTFVDFATAEEQLRAAPMHVYAYLDGRILYDPLGRLAELRDLAQARCAAYRLPEQERSRMTWLLECTRDKIRIAYAAGDLLKAAFAASTSSWQLMEGLWAANNLPVPPNSSVRPHLRDLSGPPDVARLYEDLFLGDAGRRVEVALELLDWSLGRLTD